MCGFFVTNDISLEKKDFDCVNSRLSFRGPDFQSGILKHLNWSIYHSRLSIIATDPKFSQPFFSPRGGVLVFNGEILNYTELAQKYKIRDAISDTQVLAELLDLEDFDINSLEGFFSFVFIDKLGHLKNVVRDRFGVKPLCYHKVKNTISISSEASVLSDIYDLTYDDFALEEYRVFRGPIFSESYFKYVNSVLPGTCLITGTYFDSTSQIPEIYGNFEDLLFLLNETLSQSVKSRLISDVPVGLLYSSGIDSNLIKKSVENVFECFTGGFAGDYDLEFAKLQSSERINIVEINNEIFRGRFIDMIKLRKEPLSVPNEVILSFLGESWKRKGGKVLLSGEAADEFFAGYDRIYSWALEVEDFNIDDFLAHYAYVPVEQIGDTIKEHLQEFFNNLNGLTSFEKVRQFFIKKHLPLLFRRLDFSLMYAGIEGREPLASLSMYNLAMKFNPQDLFGKSLGKLPLRLIASNQLGQEFAFKKKVGFPIDVKNIFYQKPALNRYENYSVWTKENLKILQ